MSRAHYDLPKNANIHDLEKLIAAARKAIVVVAAKKRAKHRNTFAALIFGKVKKNPNITTKRLTYEMRNVRTSWGNTKPEPNTIVTYRSMARSFLKAKSK